MTFTSESTKSHGSRAPVGSWVRGSRESKRGSKRGLRGSKRGLRGSERGSRGSKFFNFLAFFGNRINLFFFF